VKTNNVGVLLVAGIFMVFACTENPKELKLDAGNIGDSGVISDSGVDTDTNTVPDSGEDTDSITDDGGLLDSGPEDDGGLLDSGPEDDGGLLDSGPEDDGGLSNYCMHSSECPLCMECVNSACQNEDYGKDPKDDCIGVPSSACGFKGACDGFGACAYWEDTKTCNDEDACTVQDHCSGDGECIGKEVNCKDADGCCPTGCGVANDNDCLWTEKINTMEEARLRLQTL